MLPQTRSGSGNFWVRSDDCIISWLHFSHVFFCEFLSINIAGPGHDDFNSVLFHFNPRQFERGGQLVINDKQEGIWGQAIALPLSQVPLLFGQQSVTLVIQINGDGFDIFIEDKHCARLEHRKELPSKPCSLFLQFPSCDDYLSKFDFASRLSHVQWEEHSLLHSSGPENWIVYKAWWGNKPSMAKSDLSGVPGVNSFNAVHPVSEGYSLRASLGLHSLTQPSLNALSLAKPEKTIRQRPLSHSHRGRSGSSEGRTRTCFQKVWRRPRRDMHCSDQDNLRVCRDGIGSHGWSGHERNVHQISFEPSTVVATWSLAGRASCCGSSEARHQEGKRRLVGKSERTNLTHFNFLAVSTLDMQSYKSRFNSRRNNGST